MCFQGRKEQMKILMAHNYYQSPGGEDVSYNEESRLLESFGEIVYRFSRDNSDIYKYNTRQMIQLGINTIWSEASKEQVAEVIRQFKPDVAHFQNTFPLLSPSVFYACHENNIPVVLSIRNYRLFCLNGLFLRNNEPCEKCLQAKNYFWGVFHKCYHRSSMKSSIVAFMNIFHWKKRTWHRQVDVMISPSEFTRRKLIQAGFQEDRIFVKPNLIYDHGKGNRTGGYILYSGRLSQEKGINSLVDVVVENPDLKLLIIGDGPLRESIERIVESNQNIKLLGYLDHDQTINYIKNAKFLIYPTICYETFGRTIIEAFSCGVPVIASRIGAITELICDGENGFLVNPGDIQDLQRIIRLMWENDPLCKTMGDNARNDYLNRYSPDKNFLILKNAYNMLVNR